MIISAAVIVAYTTCGGFTAASVTSLVQSLIMVFALAVVLIFGINSVGGWENVIANAKAIPGYLSMTATTSIQAAEAGEFGALKIISTLAWALGYFGMPHVILHFMAIKDEKKLKLSRRVATVWVVVSLSVAVIIGIVGYSMAKENIIAMFGDASSAEALIVTIAAVLSEYGAFFAILAGLVLAGILAATMSTADVQLLAAASAIAQNIIRGVFGVELDDKKSMIVARVTVLCVAVCGVLFALDPTSSIFRVVSFAWAGFGATFGPIVLFSLYWKRCNKWGAIAGMFSGAAMVFIWKYAIAPIGGAFAIYELLPAFITSCIFIVVVSLLTKAPDAKICEDFDAVASMK
ncbi:putative sodium/proline symporter [Firmicutes bacterium CAG:240]|nr:putative sodium/proline symporter [Firmicutes bacterium CAG:240]